MKCACAILSSVTGLALNIFPQYLINGMVFFLGGGMNIKCVFWFSLQLPSETFLTLRII